jgi:hypothetical protein
MRYLSIYKSAERGGPPTAEHIAAMGRLIEELSASGELLATEGCLPTALGVRVRRDRDAYTVTDGPFTESKEVVGGFALLQAPTKDAIVALTKRFLEVAGEGECEIRQLYEAPAKA